METENLLAGLGISLFLWFVRYRFPFFPKRLASGGIGFGVGLIVVSFLTIEPLLAAAVVTISSLIAVVLDFSLASKSNDVEVASAPITLDGKARTALVRHLMGKAPANASFSIMVDTSSRSARRFGPMLREAFVEAGWNPGNGSISGGNQFPSSGIGLSITNREAAEPHIAALLAAFDAAKMPYDFIDPDFLMGDGIYITDPD